MKTFILLLNFFLLIKGHSVQLGYSQHKKLDNYVEIYKSFGTRVIDLNDSRFLSLFQNKNEKLEIYGVFNYKRDASNILIKCMSESNSLRHVKFLNGDEIDFDIKKDCTFFIKKFFSTNLIENTEYIECQYFEDKVDGSRFKVGTCIRGQQPQPGKNFKTFSMIKITNEFVDGTNKAYISMGKNKILIDTALKRYFYSDESFEYIKNAVIKSYQKYKKTEDRQQDPWFKNPYELKNIATAIDKGVKVKKNIAKVLEENKILAIYGVLTDINNKESIIWILAQNKKMGKNFHTLIHLEDDISVLLKEKINFMDKCLMRFNAIKKYL